MEARKVAWFLVMMSALLSPVAWADVLLIAPENTPAMMKLAEGIQRDLKQSVDIRLERDTGPFGASYQAVILAGTKAVQSYQGNLPALAILLDSPSYELYKHKLKSAVFHEPPLRRQIQLASALFGPRQPLAVLFSSPQELERNYPDISLHELKQLNVTGYFLSDYRSLNGALNALLAENIALIGIENKTLYSAQNIKNILITSYRQSTPLIGPNSAYLSAGSLASTYSSSEDIAKRVAEIVRQGLNEKHWPAADYNPYFRVGFNEQVARSLNILLPNAERLAEQIRQQE